jgi:hypothetical protein|tara:strand:+ start:253 stop:459 length:207 start_codon:yes stop_codon:yes gene_type:complete
MGPDDDEVDNVDNADDDINGDGIVVFFELFDVVGDAVTTESLCPPLPFRGGMERDVGLLKERDFCVVV